MSDAYKKILDEILETLDDYSRYIIISGNMDVSFDKDWNAFRPVEFKEGNFWFRLNELDPSYILESFEDYDIDVEREGEYVFDAILTYEVGERDEYGRPLWKDYLVIEHINLTLIQTFEQRDREKKLNDLFSPSYEEYDDDLPF